MNVKETDETIAHEIRKIFSPSFFTGTYAFGYPSPQDIDIVVVKDKKLAIKLLNEMGYKTKGEESGSEGSVVLEDFHINIVCVTEKDYNRWFVATQMMKVLKPIYNRDERHGLFEILRGCVKGFKLQTKECVE